MEDQMIRFITVEERFANAEIRQRSPHDTGYKRTQGKLTEISAIILYVRQKGILRRGCDIFPDEIRGYPVDAVEA
uniref:Uncharacterized protein n=1 Tax=Rhizophagus irregularis (strain DAOM 181602 / DAOM 197198 / MUCL 43194) TaxID=747089 RepID=U9T523_RHIID